MRRLKRLIWKRMSADSDGSPNGGRRFGSRQSHVPGVEANRTKILKSSHKWHPVRVYNPLRLPTTNTARFTFTTLDEKNRIYLGHSREYTTSHTPFYIIPFISATHLPHIRPHPSPILTPHDLHLFHAALLIRFRTFIRFDTLHFRSRAAPLIPSRIIPLLTFQFFYL